VATHLTRHPKTDAGRDLLALARRLTRVTTIQAAAQWAVDLAGWYGLYGRLTLERTYRTMSSQEVPSYVKPSQTWWYTHIRLRRAYRLLEKLHQQGHLFTFLDPRLARLGIPPTTNRIEGGVNRQLRILLDRHRGMPSDHQRRGVEWWLWLHWHDHPDPVSLIPAPSSDTTRDPAPDQPDTPSQWVSHPVTGDGLWVRKGWAGRPTPS
jgi:hypothetical protein